jgi:hypothetical protein
MNSRRPDEICLPPCVAIFLAAGPLPGFGFPVPVLPAICIVAGCPNLCRRPALRRDYFPGELRPGDTSSPELCRAYFSRRSPARSSILSVLFTSLPLGRLVSSRMTTRFFYHTTALQKPNPSGVYRSTRHERQRCRCAGRPGVVYPDQCLASSQPAGHGAVPLLPHGIPAQLHEHPGARAI